MRSAHSPIAITLLVGAGLFSQAHCLGGQAPTAGPVAAAIIPDAPLPQLSVTPQASSEPREQSAQDTYSSNQTGADAIGGAPQSRSSSPAQPNGTVSGTVTDEAGDLVPGAAIVIENQASGERRSIVANDDGFFTIDNVRAQVTYRLTIRADGFSEWKSEELTLTPGQYLIVKSIALRVNGGPTTVTVTASPAELAAEEVQVEEKQRVLGFIPNFYVVYDRNPAPLTAKLKFKLALKISVDPVTFFGVGFLSGVNQAADTPDFGQGFKGYAQRYGALYTDGFTDLMIGGAILPSVLHQDPRYFYKGEGTTRSRVMHALASPFWCRNDNGNWQFNYSSVGGDLISSAISESYYPQSNRGPGFLISTFLIDTSERMVSALAQEFLLRKLTPSAAKNTNNN
jgi:hypothetical protein